jgi:DNA-binding transcriptional ArsR family regulator
VKKINKIYKENFKQKIPKNSWWFPVWKGLIIDSNAKHRINMATSIWLYLYLLLSVNRKNGITSKKQKDMAKDLGYSVRTIQKHLFRLKSNGYITIEEQVKMPKIQITKWKLFNYSKPDDS